MYVNKGVVRVGDIIGEYFGKIIDQETYDSLDDEQDTMVFELKTKGGQKTYIDAAHCDDKGDLAIVSFINLATDKNQRKDKQLANCKFKQVEDSIYVVATKNIRINEEIMIDTYGDKYDVLITKLSTFRKSKQRIGHYSFKK